jgi:thioredoxin-related protein
MKQRLLQSLSMALVIALVLPLAACSGEKSGLKWMSFSDGVKEAQKTHKKMLVDVYTDWCVWCKRMDANTYTDKKLASYLNSHYILVKLDAESPRTHTFMGKQYTEQQLAGAFGVTGYPSTLFLKAEGDLITVYPGYADAQRFQNVVAFIAEDHYLTTSFDDFVAARKTK